MFKNKELQNAETNVTWFDGKNSFSAKVVTTETKLLVYNSKSELIAKAGVKYAKDFDFNVLLSIARQKSNLEVA